MKTRNFLVVSLTLGAALLAVPAIAKADALPAAAVRTQRSTRYLTSGPTLPPRHRPARPL